MPLSGVPALSNARHEKFALQIAGEKSLKQAYAEIYAVGER